MKRRAFIAALGSAAVVARAQQTERMRRIAFLHSLAENDPEVQGRIPNRAGRWYQRGAGKLRAGRPASAMRAILTTDEERVVAPV